ncbi:hypothetical protein HY492_02160, partial [Candidatus Woesearchaeota archaeon]|nr:hypothetical protein [Candidatus Woesearchaeota archaeon]
FGILGALTFWIPFVGSFITLMAILLSKAALSKIKRHPKKFSGNAFAVIGLLLGVMFFILSLCALGLVVFLFGSGYLVGRIA